MWTGKEKSLFRQMTANTNWSKYEIAVALLSSIVWMFFAVQCLFYFHEGKLLHGATYVGFVCFFTPLLLGPSGLQVIDATKDPLLHKLFSILGLLGGLIAFAGLIARLIVAQQT
jgi:hypothetical protein